METISEHNEENLPLTDQEIFTQIWTSPRRLFKFINDWIFRSMLTLSVSFIHRIVPVKVKCAFPL